MNDRKLCTDSVSLAGVRKTSEGYLIADVFAVRTGVQQYVGAEVGRPDLAIVNVYRAPEEVFSADTLQSFSHVPVTNDHPSVGVTADNWRMLAVGEASSDVLRDGERMKIPLILKDAQTIALVEGGKRELSAGYTCGLVFEDGVAPDGTRYQARQTQIRANHIAVVSKGRAGPEFRIGDSWGATPPVAASTRVVVVDGKTYHLSDAEAQAIEKLQGQLQSKRAEEATLAARIVAKDGEIRSLNAQIADAARQSVASVQDRTKVLIAARSLIGNVHLDRMSEADIKRIVVTRRCGLAITRDASDETISGMFAALSMDEAAGARGVDPVRQAFMRGGLPTADAKGDGHDTYVNRLLNDWKPRAEASEGVQPAPTDDPKGENARLTRTQNDWKPRYDA